MTPQMSSHVILAKEKIRCDAPALRWRHRPRPHASWLWLCGEWLQCRQFAIENGHILRFGESAWLGGRRNPIVIVPSLDLLPCVLITVPFSVNACVQR